ncbi:hypothetical protein OS493_037977 [Desmophyllum pertusum]|uniref:CUB domain-containing protein n=1 Tax=Desmophyllum pertusum TaxID=174260 RepID=A0A9W9ZWD8_9CNID|nr:hypothetical protein OS493_037977 [Desmophyllum pertusum]
MDKINCFTMIVLFLLHVFMWNNKYGALATQGCGSMVNNTLKSPGYPNDYPRNMHCVYSFPIPYGMAIEIRFSDFDVEDHRSCRYDYLSISNENNHTFGVYCGQKTGQIVSITGDEAVITFHTDEYVQERGFLLFFTAIPIGCGSLVNNSLTSPGYPNNYPSRMDCVYSFPIPYGMAMKIVFADFYLESHPSCV